ncbi:hypothetical protein HN51_013220, partial [Arachis hypogaea]
MTPKDDLCVLACCEFCVPSRFTSDREQAVAGGRGLPPPFLSRLRITCVCLIKIVSLQKFSSLLIGFQALVVIKLYAVARFGALKLKRYTGLLNSWL